MKEVRYKWFPFGPWRNWKNWEVLEVMLILNPRMELNCCVRYYKEKNEVVVKGKTWTFIFMWKTYLHKYVLCIVYERKLEFYLLQHPTPASNIQQYWIRRRVKYILFILLLYIETNIKQNTIVHSSHIAFLFIPVSQPWSTE